MITLTPRIGYSVRSLALAATLGLSAVVSHAQTLLSHYTLDGTVEDSGSLGVGGVLNNSATFTASGGGVGIFDKAFSTGDGVNRYFSAATGGNAAFGLDAMTITLWVNVSSGAGNDRLVSNITKSSGFDLFLSSVNASSYRLTFGINGTSGGNTVSSTTSLDIGKWVFVAVTYDSVNVRFYSGDEETAAALNTTVSKEVGSIIASLSNLEIGGTPATGEDRTPVALFNDVRIYDGALSLSELEAIRGTAVIPEPSNYAAMLGVFSMGLLAMRGMRSRR